MATSRRDPQQAARVNLKPSESGKGLRRARSVPTSPDRRSSPSPASISDNACRPASSFNARTTSSRSTSSSASSSHGKTLRSASSSSMAAGARQTNTARRKADKPGATSVWPPAAAVPNASSKDMPRAAKSPSTTAQKTRAAAAASSAKLKPQKTTAGPLGAGKTQAASSTRAPGTTTKKRTGAENYVSIQRTTSVPATVRQIETRKSEEQDVELLMEFDEKESISTSSIEEHLHERLPDPVDLKSVDLDSSKTSSSQEEHKDQENAGDNLEEKRDGEDSEDLSTGDKAYVGNSGINILMKEAVDESELVGAVDETGLKKDVCAAELNETVGQNEFSEAVSETESKEADDEAKIKQVDCETASKEAASGTESRDAVTEHEMTAQEKATTKEKIMQPMKAVEFAKWRKDDEGRSSEATEEGRSSKSVQERKNKVMALVGRFETAMSGRGDVRH